MTSSRMLQATHLKLFRIYHDYHKNSWYVFTRVWKFIYRRLKHDDKKHPLQWPVANLRFSCPHKRAKLLPIIKAK